MHYFHCISLESHKIRQFWADLLRSFPWNSTSLYLKSSNYFCRYEIFFFCANFSLRMNKINERNGIKQFKWEIPSNLFRFLFCSMYGYIWAYYTIYAPRTHVTYNSNRVLEMLNQLTKDGGRFYSNNGKHKTYKHHSTPQFKCVFEIRNPKWSVSLHGMFAISSDLFWLIECPSIHNVMPE